MTGAAKKQVTPRVQPGLQELAGIAAIVVIGISAAALLLEARVRTQSLSTSLQQYAIVLERMARNVNQVTDPRQVEQFDPPVIEFFQRRLDDGLKQAAALQIVIDTKIDELGAPVTRRLAMMTPLNTVILRDDSDTLELREFARKLADAKGDDIRRVALGINPDLAVPLRYGDYLDRLRQRVALSSELLQRGTRPLMILLLLIGIATLIGIWAVWRRGLKPTIAELERKNMALARAGLVVQNQNLSYLRRETESLTAQRVARFGYWIVDQRGQLHHSEGLAEVLGLPHAALPNAFAALTRIGRTVAGEVPQQTDDAYHDYINHIERRGAIELTRVIETADGDRIIRERIEISQEQATGERRLIGVMSDVSELARAQTRAARAEKFESIGLVAGVIAHDINNVLAIVRANVDLLMTNEAKIPQRIEAIRRSVTGAASLIARLSMISKGQDEQAEVFNPVLALIEITRHFRADALISMKINVEDLTAVSPAVVRLNRGQFENVVRNLLLNASEAAAVQGPKLRITCKQVIDPVVDGPISHALSGKFVGITFVDNGSGMSSTVLQRAIDPFFSTKERTTSEPRGLGLWSAYTLVSDAGGGLAITSREGAGTAITLYLPVWDEASKRAAPAIAGATGAGDATGADLPILIVDDQEDLLHVIAEQLTLLGYRTLTATSIGSAQRTLATEPLIQVVVSDVRLANGESGLELASYIRNSYPDKSVVLISGHHATQDTTVFDLPLVRKPIDIHELDRAIQKSAGQKIDTAGEMNPMSA